MFFIVLSYSGITVLSFANKVVKVQLQKFVRSLYGVPRALQYALDKVFEGEKIMKKPDAEENYKVAKMM